MAIVEMNRTIINRLLGRKIRDDAIKDILVNFGIGVEEISQDKLTLEILPNRPDLLSEVGIIRLLASYLGIASNVRHYRVIDNEKYLVYVDKNLSKIRPHIRCFVAKGLSFDEDMIKILINAQERLHKIYARDRERFAIGIYPLHKFKFPLTYTALEPEEIRFVPLDSTKEMNGKEILRKHPKGIEFSHLLEHAPLYPVLMDADHNVLSMPPIINSESSGKVTTDTKQIFVECTGFNEHLLDNTIAILASMFYDLGAEIYSVKIVYRDGNMEGKALKTLRCPNLNEKKVLVDISYINKLLGVKLSIDEVIALAENSGFNASKVKNKGNKNRSLYDNDKIEFFIPRYRVDILHPVDIVEDLAIAYDYDKIPSQRVVGYTLGKEDIMVRMLGIIREILIGFSLIETVNFNLISSDVQEQILGKEFINNIIKVSNPKSKVYDALRLSLIPSLIMNLKDNASVPYPHNIFEIGQVFYTESIDKNNKTEGCRTLVNNENNLGVVEGQNLGIALCDCNKNFTDLISILKTLFFTLGFDSIRFKERYSHIYNCFIEGRVAEILVSGKGIGIVGELHPDVLVKYNIEHNTFVAEIDLSKLFSLNS